MNCQQAQKLIQAHHDGELDAANTLQVDEHLADCPQCFNKLRELSALRTALKGNGLRFKASSSLRSSIRTAVHQAARAEEEAPVATPWYRHIGLVAAVAGLAGWIAAVEFRPASAADTLAAELTSSHVRSLLASHLMDVVSTDQHTVKPWFDGKIDFAPPVKDLRDVGFPLVGGRLDFVEGRTAAALIYGRQKHLLNLFVWPAESPAPQKLKATQYHGYNLLRWADGKMNYGLISDLNETELREFVGDWTGR